MISLSADEPKTCLTETHAPLMSFKYLQCCKFFPALQKRALSYDVTSLRDWLFEELSRAGTKQLAVGNIFFFFPVQCCRKNGRVLFG